MALQQQDRGSLKHRVDQILRASPGQYAAEASEEDSVAVIFEMLQRAEADLASAEERVGRLKWELAKAQEHQP